MSTQTTAGDEPLHPGTWDEAFADMVHGLPDPHVQCPECHGGELSVLFYGDKPGAMGSAELSCSASGHSQWYSRVRIPEGVAPLPYQKAQGPITWIED